MNHVSIFILSVTIITISSALAIIATADDSKVPQDQIQQFLSLHNDQARAKVGVPPLVWNETLASYAKAVAEKNKHGGGHEKSPYGENITGGYGTETLLSCVSIWLNERDNYDHSTNTCQKGKPCAEYLQIVWRNTTSFGCYFTGVERGFWPICACEYYPPGNVPGQSPY